MQARVREMGGLRAWKLEREVRTRWNDDGGADDGMDQAESASVGEGQTRGDDDDDDDDDEGLSMGMMLSMLGIECEVVGWDARRGEWVE